MSQVHAFEPTPDTFKLLHQNVQINNLQNVVVNNIALSDQAGTAELFLASPANSGANSLCLGEGTASVQVVCRTLDEYVAEKRIPESARMVLKIDVEGAEVRVLRGAERLIELGPTMLIEVLDKDAQAAVEALLRPRGFSISNLDDCNILCRPAEGVKR